MRLPRHDTPLTIAGERPRQAISADEALLEKIQADGPPLERWWLPSRPAVVIGIGLRSRLASVVDMERCRASNVEILERRAGGGALLLDQHTLCGAICVPSSQVSSDVTESYRWLGDHLANRLRSLGIGARRVDVDEARADVAGLRSRSDEGARLILATCYGALSPHEVVVGAAKIVGLAQVRRRHAALFVIGVLLRDQWRLAEYLLTSEREAVRNELEQRTIGLESLTSRPFAEVVEAIAGATPSAP